MANDKIKETMEELHKVLDINNFVGKPIETEDKILIPLVRTGVAFGSGEGNGTKSTGEAVAAAAGVEPVSMVVISKGIKGTEGIRVLNLSKGSEMNKAISDLSLVISDLVKEVFSPKQEAEYYDYENYVDAEVKDKKDDKINPTYNEKNK